MPDIPDSNSEKKERRYDGLKIGSLKLLPSGTIVLELPNGDTHLFNSKVKVLVKRDLSKMKILIEADGII
jgi:hypothetical protein